MCSYWEDTFKERVRLIAFISLRDFFVNKNKIRFAYPDSYVFPMIPGIENWKLNTVRLSTFFLFRKKEKVIARGVFATMLALESKKFAKVCFDARGAYEAEWSEYLKEHSPALAAKMKEMEKEALTKADYRIAVSQKLVEYWKEQYGYEGSNHVVIPCTLDSSNPMNYDKTIAEKLRKEFKVADDEILLVYSGSSAQWQSFGQLEEHITKALAGNPKIKLLMLAKQGAGKVMAERFPGRVIQAWVRPDEVYAYLYAGDYGLLIREASVTNKVSSPVKFAEYLAAGLQVIISEGIGDYSNFVKEHNSGMLVNTVNWASLKRPNEVEKQKITATAKASFSKASYKEQYDKVKEM